MLIFAAEKSEDMTLRDLNINESGRILAVGGEGALRQHLLDMGMIPDAQVRVVKFAPMGDPVQVQVQDYELTLRLSDAAQIEVERISGNAHRAAEEARNRLLDDTLITVHENEHPGLGEGGRYHTEHTSPINTPLTFALMGNQNCGKTTLFNQLTGANQHVGNFPGVTVDSKSGQIRGHQNAEVVDLPGIYSLSPYTAEEVVSRDFVLRSHPDGIINIVDATNIERNLYLTMQLLELGIPMVLALNMMDEVEGNGGTIRINVMEEALGIPVVAISASKNEGIDELIRHAIHVARYKESPARQDFCSPLDNGGAVHRCLHAVMHLIEDHAQDAGLPLRFAASKVVEGDTAILSRLNLSDNELATVRHILRQLEQERGLDASAAMAEMRFAFLSRLCAKTVVKPRRSREHIRSLRIDSLLTGRWTALPSFVVIIGLVFWLTFESIGAWLQAELEAAIGWVTSVTDQMLTRFDVNGVVHSLIIDGAFAGVGSVLSFVPLIVLLFFFLSLLEDSGYMARIAFVTDRLLRRIGLSGRSIVPMLIGFGCSVPSVMASRTLPSDRDRRLTILLTPFMSCTAKVAVYVFLIQPFFGDMGWLVMVGLYLLGIVIGIIVALIAKTFVLRGEAAPFVMELPNYRMPGVRNVGHLLWDKTRDFIQRAFTVIFVASIIIWFLQNFNFRLQMTDPTGTESILATIAGWISPIFSPMGFADWRITTALVTGFMAKESVVSTLQTLSAGVPVNEIIDQGAAICLLVFCLLYTPCVAAIAAIRRELGVHYSVVTVVLQCLIAWVVAWLFSLFV